MNQPNKAFKVYQASAGSGKTYTIVKEYLELCLKDEGSINNYNHILAITFTNMAANEMKAKILNHLADIINSDLGEEPKASSMTTAASVSPPSTPSSNNCPSPSPKSWDCRRNSTPVLMKMLSPTPSPKE